MQLHSHRHTHTSDPNHSLSKHMPKSPKGCPHAALQHTISSWSTSSQNMNRKSVLFLQNAITPQCATTRRASRRTCTHRRTTAACIAHVSHRCRLLLSDAIADCFGCAHDGIAMHGTIPEIAKKMVVLRCLQHTRAHFSSCVLFFHPEPALMHEH